MLFGGKFAGLSDLTWLWLAYFSLTGMTTIASSVLRSRSNSTRSSQSRRSAPPSRCWRFAGLARDFRGFIEVLIGVEVLLARLFGVGWEGGLGFRTRSGPVACGARELTWEAFYSTRSRCWRFAFGIANQRWFVLLVILAAGVPISLMTGNSVYFAALGGMAGQAAWLLAIVVGCLAALLAVYLRPTTPGSLAYSDVSPVPVAGRHQPHVDTELPRRRAHAGETRCAHDVLLGTAGPRPDATFARRIETALYAGCLISVMLAVVNQVSGGGLAPLAMKGGLGGLPALAAPYTSPANFSFLILVGAIAAYCRFLQSRRVIHGLLFLVFIGTVALAFVRISLAGSLIGIAAVHLVRARPIATACHCRAAR